MTPETEAKLYTIAQAQSWLAARGLRVGNRTLLRWCTNGQLAAVRIGKRYYIDEPDLRALLAGEPATKT